MVEPVSCRTLARTGSLGSTLRDVGSLSSGGMSLGPGGFWAGHWCWGQVCHPQRWGGSFVGLGAMQNGHECVQGSTLTVC